MQTSHSFIVLQNHSSYLVLHIHSWPTESWCTVDEANCKAVVRHCCGYPSSSFSSTPSISQVNVPLTPPARVIDITEWACPCSCELVNKTRQQRMLKACYKLPLHPPAKYFKRSPLLSPAVHSPLAAALATTGSGAPMRSTCDMDRVCGYNSTGGWIHTQHDWSQPTVPSSMEGSLISKEGVLKDKCKVWIRIFQHLRH